MDTFFDVIVIGGGPAGLTAALYLARARYRVLVVEKEKFGGQITITSEVVNYPGVLHGSGEEITSLMRAQAERFGAEFLLAEVKSVNLVNEEKIIQTTRGEYQAFGVIIATGAHPRTIGFDGEEAFRGRGVAYCATCDGEFFTGMDVFVVGGGFAAAEESVFLTKYAKHVKVLVRKEDFSCAKATADEIKKHKSITILYNTEVEAVSGDDQIRSIRYRNRKSGEVFEYHSPENESFGVFVFAGYAPETALVKGQIELDEQNYIKTDENGKTNIKGVYAAGDVRQKALRQMVTATSDGAVAATELEKHIAAMQRKTGKVPERPITRINPKQEQIQDKAKESGFFSDEIRTRLDGVFGKMHDSLVLSIKLDSRPVSSELESFVHELNEMTDKINVEYHRETLLEDFAPCIHVLRQDHADTGIAFHGIPGGHEFNSFVIGLYNAAGPGQTVDVSILKRIQSINKPVDMKIMISLSCTMCPDLVMAAQKMAAENPLIRAEAYDLNHFPELRERFKVMSVPCLVINDAVISFGKKNVAQLLDYIEQVI